MKSNESQVVVFSALDRQFSQPVFDSYEKETGVKVLAKYDTESTKTVGLANQILQQDQTAACDLFWNNEILHTLRLEQAGKLKPLNKELLHQVPANFQSPEGNWIGLAARARVIIVNTDLVDVQQEPTSIDQWTKPKWKGKVCLAKPLFGTTATHFAVLYQQLGKEKFTQLIQELKQNQVAIVSGNRQVAADVAAGKYSWGITDTDDFNLEKRAGSPVKLIFPDQGEDQSGALFIPNTLALIAGGKNQEQAKRLAKTILQGKVEAELAEGPSAQFPLNQSVTATSPLSQPDLKWMEVDWSKTVQAWNESSKLLTEAFY